MQKLNELNAQPTQHTEVQDLSTFAVNAANVLSILGLVFGSIITYELLFAQPAIPNVEHPAATQAMTQSQSTSDLAEQ